jgi:hypothetical protein
VTGGRTSAFDYAMKSAKWAISHAAYVEGYVHIDQAKTMAATKVEIKSVLQSVDVALQGMTKTKTRINFFPGRNPEHEAYKSYKYIKEELECRLKELSPASHPGGNSSPPVTIDIPPSPGNPRNDLTGGVQRTSLENNHVVVSQAQPLLSSTLPARITESKMNEVETDLPSASLQQNDNFKGSSTCIIS